MLSLQNIYVQFSDRILYDRVNLTIKPGERVGLVGRNGAGKSTLLKIIAGEQLPDEGKIDRPSGFTIGYLHQDMFLPRGRTVIEEALTAFESLKEMEARMAFLETELGERTDYETEAYSDLVTELSDLSERLHLLGGTTMQAEAERILSGLGFKHKDLQRPTTEFSGGWQMRVELAKMLLRSPNLLLLDEPTNHLDIESILWLENFLRGYTGMAIIISHDRRFLDETTNRTVEIMLGKLNDYKAPYSRFVELSAERRIQMAAAYENQQRVIADKERTISRFMAKATKTKMAQSMQKQLDKIERIEIEDEDLSTMLIRFPDAPRSGEVVTDVQNLSKSYGQLHVLTEVNLKILRGERVAFVGQNGQGKSTLAKIIVGRENTTGGAATLGHNVSIGYYAQNQAESLDPKLTLLETMELHSPPEMRVKLRAILGAFLFSGEDVDKKVVVLSGGERARLALACMLLRPFNLLVLDEPTNHLDMLSKEVLKQALNQYNGTLLVVSHDRDFLSDLTDRTIEFRDQQLYEYLGDVNYFLEKRALDNMRDVEAATKVAKAESNGTKPGLSHEAQRDLQRDIKKIEKRIAELEELIAKREASMADPAFFGQPNSNAQLAEYKGWQQELDKAMSQWEALLETSA